jgi:hypothetical protein
MIVGVATVENTMFHVLVETETGEGDWTDFLSFNTTQSGVRMLLAHAAERQSDDETDAPLRITIGPRQASHANDPELPSDPEVTLYLESNW